MNENLSRLTVQITKHQHKLLKYHAGPGTSISSLVRQALSSYFADAEEALRENTLKQQSMNSMKNTWLHKRQQVLKKKQ